MDESKDSAPKNIAPKNIAPANIAAEGAETPKPESAKPESAKLEAAKLDLPHVDAPSVSPAGPLTEPVIEPTPILDPVAAAPSTLLGVEIVWPAFNVPKLRPRQKRYALLAASVVFAGALGAIVGAAASGTFRTAPPQINVAATEEQKATEQSIARLNKEIAALKTNLEAANKAAHTQIAKISERADRIERNASAELVTGSITPPQTVPAAAVPTPVPRPAPRIAAPEATPAPRMAAAEVQQQARRQIIQDWAIREARDGYVYVQGHGDVFQVVPGAPLPGLGAVESIKRLDGRWVVTTPKGIIVSMRDRRYFE